jgi:hypothetical protein
MKMSPEWIALADTSFQTAHRPEPIYHGATAYPLQPWSLALLSERAAGLIRLSDRGRVHLA